MHCSSSPFLAAFFVNLTMHYWFHSSVSTFVFVCLRVKSLMVTRNHPVVFLFQFISSTEMHTWTNTLAAGCLGGGGQSLFCEGGWGGAVSLASSHDHTAAALQPANILLGSFLAFQQPSLCGFQQ
jgi:hypothetical protein